MTKQEFIASEVTRWGEDYIFDLIDKGYEAVMHDWNGTSRWWWRLPATDDLTQPTVCAMLPASRTGVSPVSSVR